MTRFLKRHWPLLFLFVLALVTRLPFQSQILYEHDTVNFAWAMEDFDLERHQPHAPGTFIILILSARWLNLWLHDANQSLVTINILAMAIAAPAIYQLGSLWFNRSVGWIAAFLVLSSPLTWFYSEVGLSYTLELAWVTLLAIACHYTRNGDRRALLLSAFLLGLAGGIRPNTPIFLFPLWSISVGLGWRKNAYQIGEILLAAGVAFVGVLLWFVPLLVMCGGWSAYQIAIANWLDSHLEDTNTLSEILANLWLWFCTILMALGSTIIPLLSFAWSRRSDLPNFPIRDWRAQAMLLWSFPSLIYLTFVHFQRQGHSYTVVPIIFLLAALSLYSYIQQHPSLSLQQARLWIIGFILCNTVLFIAGPAEWRTWTRIRDHDRYVGERVTAITQTFPPSSTTVLSTGHYARLVSYYFRDYHSPRLGTILTNDLAFIDPRVNTLVLFDSAMLSELPPEIQVQTLPLPDGDRLRYIQWDLPKQVKVSQQTLQIEE
ncbi:hypothetical protein [Roseofilum casamattae]|uniref:Glycosyltransferase RgtA/B/C/D-like domain-containing protein n=1 Tax=Roseofilum casamattae BLCC-M143 TaxID=3022442 RepID=A0ABT7C1Z3_9CYAN|nr:hypothetical protein [Roseofilum casamattae]MDJ1185440.1 hypothetical protein [Roseofilum casamattae BLCC-M143]